MPLDDSFVLDDLVMGNTQGTFTTSRFQAQVLEDIREYSHTGLPSPHRPGSTFWPILPYFMRDLLWENGH